MSTGTSRSVLEFEQIVAEFHLSMTQPIDSAKIAIVDFAHFLDGSDKQSVADAILASFKHIGFVYLVNHGLPDDKIRSTLLS